jgi:hypothetical protein
MLKVFLTAFQNSNYKLGFYAAILSAACLWGQQTIAGELNPSKFSPAANIPPAMPTAEITDFTLTTDSEADSKEGMEQVTSVSQLTDVKPSDWAYESLRSLVERYGAISGYPDGYFRGNRSLTRYEFASALNTALKRFDELLSTNSNAVKKEDLEAVRKLQEGFAQELESVRSRVDNLENRTTFLENHNFSTLTKFSSLVSFTFAGATAGGNVKVERSDINNVFTAQRGANGQPVVNQITNAPPITFSEVAVLYFLTSFSGRDLLGTSFIFGNGFGPANSYASANLFNTFGTPLANIGTFPTNSGAIFETFYSFPINNDIQFTFGPKLLWLRHFDTNAFTSAFGRGASGFNTFGSTLLQGLSRNTGAVVDWRISEQFDLKAGYFTTTGGNLASSGLLDNTTNSLTAQLSYSPNPNLNLRFIYDYAKNQPIGGQITEKPIIGIADDGFGGSVRQAIANTAGVNVDWLLSQNFGLFGRYTYTDMRIDPVTAGRAGGNIRAQSLQLGVAFPDLGKPGALATLSYVLPFSILDGRKFFVSGNGDGGVQYDIEASYYYPLTDNIALIPIFHVTGNANNFSSNPTVYSGTFRTQFTF